MRWMGTSALVRAIRAQAYPLQGAATDYDPLLDLIGDARIVLLGEASHGTHEFYHERAVITKRLIVQRGFTAVVAEADWPHAYRVNQWVRGAGSDADANAALGGFRRFPRWLWRNTVVRDWVQWLRNHNAALPPHAPRTGFYGCDVYSLHQSIDAVLAYLDVVDPAAAARARDRYACFADGRLDGQQYGRIVQHDPQRSCADAAAAQLEDLQRHATLYLARNGSEAAWTYFNAEQNARLVRGAEAYYRTMVRGRVSAWNVRDTHMADTVDAVLAYLDRQGGQRKVVVWAHNSHVGDVRATERRRRGQINLGQLMRERHGDAAVLVGFSTYTGTVTAASEWGASAERMQMRPARGGSYEALLHATGLPRFALPLREHNAAVAGLRSTRLERAIGVVYRPHTERHSHYLDARLPDQFDAIVHLDATHAVQPLEPSNTWHQDEETDPYARKA